VGEKNARSAGEGAPGQIAITKHSYLGVEGAIYLVLIFRELFYKTVGGPLFSLFFAKTELGSCFKEFLEMLLLLMPLDWVN